MNRNAMFVLSVCLLAGFPAPAIADSSMEFPGCGKVLNRNNSHQFGIFNWLEYIVETEGNLDVCGQFFVAVEANVPGVSNSGIRREGLMYVSARRQVMVPKYGRWQTNGAHYTTFWFPNPTCCWGWWPTGNTVSFADVRPPQQQDPSYACSLRGSDYYWNGFECVYAPGSPIIVDAGRNGYRLTSVDDGVRFDLNADGISERVAWTMADSDDAFLAMDRNGNGRIDDGTELFGNRTPAYPDGGRADITTENGFEALAFLSSSSYGRSVPDGRIDAQDAAFSRLLLWRDLNHNGLSEPGELQSAAEAGVVSIGSEYKTQKRVDRFGNEFRQKGKIVWPEGEQPVYDVWLKWRD